MQYKITINVNTKLISMCLSKMQRYDHSLYDKYQTAKLICKLENSLRDIQGIQDKIHHELSPHEVRWSTINVYICKTMVKMKSMFKTHVLCTVLLF